jgi:3-phenylpropionate/trans-cinnamate dioxygenase ferredoxin reductase component
VRPPIDGADLPGVHVLRSARHADALRAATGPGTQVAVVGSGFVGCEAAASLARRGAAVTLLSDEEAPQARRLGAEVGGLLAAWLREEGVELRLGAPVQRIGAAGSLLRVDDVVEADLVLLGSGVAPNDDLARGAGLALGRDDAFVAVDATMATSAPGVWAAGDVTLVEHPVAGRPLHVEHWGEALAMGEVAGRQAAGDVSARWDGVPGFWSTIGDRTLKLHAWGDGHDEARVDGDAGGFAATYVRDGRIVGVLAHERDEAYEAAQERILGGERA